MSAINIIVLLPILNAILIALGAPARKSAILSAWCQLGLTLMALVGYDHVRGGFQYRSAWDVAPAWDLSLQLGVDGLSLVMLLLTALVTVAAVHCTPKIEKRENLFYACVLLISAGAAGAFASLDLFFFYAFHELALILRSSSSACGAMVSVRWRRGKSPSISRWAASSCSSASRSSTSPSPWRSARLT
jgi:NADH-quinone oxidoreductase subunit M